MNNRGVVQHDAEDREGRRRRKRVKGLANLGLRGVCQDNKWMMIPF